MNKSLRLREMFEMMNMSSYFHVTKIFRTVTVIASRYIIMII